MGIDKDNILSASAELRSQAEEQLKADLPVSGLSRTDTETQQLLHELQVHQIELEMQNAELLQARDEVETALGKYTDLYDFAPVGYFTLDRNGVISAVNLSGASLLGIERTRLLGRRFGLFVTEEARQLFTEFLGKVFASQSKESCDVTLTTEGNLPLIVQVEAVAFGPGHECRVALIDITDRRKAEEGLRESEERLWLALSAAKLAAWDWHVPSGTLVWNDEHYRMLGYEPGEVIPSYRAWVDRLHPDDIDSMETRIKEYMADGRDYSVEFRTLWPDGTIRWLEARGKFECNKAGQTLHGYGVMVDRTDRKLIENALRQAHDELETANIELEAFNYSVSHDLRSPLTTISNYCQVVEELCGSKLDENCRGYIRKMYDGTLRMNRLIDTLLDFSRITRVEMRHDKVDLSKMAEEVAVTLKVSEPERRVTFRIAEGIVVNGDTGLLRVVLDNLIGNAWKYVGNREAAVIQFDVTEIDGSSACFVKDNGSGFDMVHADKLFIPFQRLPGKNVDGYGIGLATVERIIRRHCGRIWGEGETGKGACFYFTLSAD